jgi:flagellar basal-body rod modification protein FlgD
MTSITTVNSQNVKVQPAGTLNKTLDQTAFLRLMTTQLKSQDPFDPVDNQAMVAQMAQFSSVAGISEMNTTLRDISTQISAQTELLNNIRNAGTADTATSTNTLI